MRQSTAHRALLQLYEDLRELLTDADVEDLRRRSRAKGPAEMRDLLLSNADKALEWLHQPGRAARAAKLGLVQRQDLIHAAAAQVIHAALVIEAGRQILDGPNGAAGRRQALMLASDLMWGVDWSWPFERPHPCEEPDDPDEE